MIQFIESVSEVGKDMSFVFNNISTFLFNSFLIRENPGESYMLKFLLYS